MMQLAAQTSIPVHVLIRPRAGDFCFNASELNCMAKDIDDVNHNGLSGVVLGAACEDHTLDLPALQQLCTAADGLTKTLHRVIDTVADPCTAVDQAIDLGFDYILTSGGCALIKDGLKTLGKMHHRANGQIQIIAGSGLTPALMSTISNETGVRNFHASCRKITPINQRLVELGFASKANYITDEALIREFKTTASALDVKIDNV